MEDDSRIEMRQSRRSFCPASPPIAGDRGFTLLEVMITLVVLACVTMSSILVIIPISRQNRINREISTANNEARRVIEVIQGAPLSTITAIYPSGVEIPVNAAYAGTLQNGKVVVVYDDPAADPLHMRMTLSWDSSELGPMARTFFSARTR